MKKNFLNLSLIVFGFFLIGCSGTTSKEGNSEKKPPAETETVKEPVRGSERLSGKYERMGIALSDEQKSQIEKLFDSQGDISTLSKEAKTELRKKLNKEIEEQILTDEQRLQLKGN